MAFRQVGVRATVRGFSRYMNEIKRMSAETTKTTKSITDSVMKEKYALGELEIAYRKNEAALNKLIEEKKKGTIAYDEAILKQGKLKWQMDMSKRSIAGMTGSTATLGAVVKGAVLVIGGLVLAVGLAYGAFKLATGVIKTVTNIITTVVRAVWDGIRAFGSFAKAVADPVFEMAVAIFERLAKAISSVVKEAWGGAEEFQRLAIRFQGLVASEIQAAGVAQDFTEAMRMAQKPAADLVYWMQRLAVTTPFSRRDVSETVAFAMAMGFSSNMAQKLTLAIGEHVSGMGLQSDAMERIILQFGQMMAGGRLYGTELRDLARGAFVPVNEIIRRVAENLGTTANEWQRMAAEGRTSILPFFEEFINLAHERFPGAMDRMNKTLTAVKQNIHDFITEFLGVKLLFPALESLSTNLEKALNQLLAPRAMEAFRLAGTYLGGLVDELFRLAKIAFTAATGLDDLRWVAVQAAALIAVVAEKLTKALRGTEDTVARWGETFRRKAWEAFQWGVNIIAQFAMGMISGAARFLTWAMNTISRMIASWLAPGSPPRIAPNLPEWGAAALTEWLKGMGRADFSVLRAIQSPLREALEVMALMGGVAESEVGILYKQFSEALIEGLGGEGITEDVLDAIRSSLGDFGAEIVDLTRLELDLVKAIKAVEDAERALEDARKRHTQATADVAREITEYNRMLREGADESQLAAQRELINQAQRRRVVAARDIEASSDQLEAAQAQRAELEEITETQRELVRQLLELARAQFEWKDKAEKAGKGVGGALEDIEDQMQDLVDFASATGVNIQTALEEAFLKAKRNIEEKWATLFDPLKEKWNESVGKAFAALGIEFDDFRENVLAPLARAFGISMGGGEGNSLDAALVNVKNRVKELLPQWKVELKGVLDTFIDTVLPNLSEALKLVGDGIVRIADAIMGRETGDKDPISVMIELIGKTMEIASDWTVKIARAFNDFADAAANVASGLREIKDAWINWPTKLQDWILGGGIGEWWRSIDWNAPYTPSPYYGGPPSHQHGAWHIPSDNYLANLHAGEMVLPRAIAQQVRAMAAAPVAAPAATAHNTISFGDININDNMSWAEAQSRAERMVGGLL